MTLFEIYDNMEMDVRKLRIGHLNKIEFVSNMLKYLSELINF